jgi:transposase
VDLSGGTTVVTNDTQVVKLMKELGKGEGLAVAALRAGLSEKTARKYQQLGVLPSSLKTERTWLTHADAFAEDFGRVEKMLEEAPELEAQVLFDWLCEQRPGRYEEGQLRTFQRRVARWRAQRGPEQEVFFAQEHRPGEAAQTDFTWCDELGVTLAGVPFPHKLCHVVLPYSNWEWATVCQSESMAALRKGVSAALRRLGRVPTWHQTDNSTAATHQLPTGKRDFNEEYVDFMAHFGMKPRTIGVGESEQNGDVEAANGALKRWLKQHLLLRGSRDFASEADYTLWLEALLGKANSRRERRFQEELLHMRPLDVPFPPEHSVLDVSVSAGSLIRVKHHVYSVPSRLIGQNVRVHLYDDRLEIFHQGVSQFTVERLHGKGGARINYRHLIWSLVKKPGAFAQYRYREELFPSGVFRRAYDALQAVRPGFPADREYLRILHLAAAQSETDVAVALELLLEPGASLRSVDDVKALVGKEATEIPALAPLAVCLDAYDTLLRVCGREGVR